MKLFLLILSALLFSSCSIYTVENKSPNIIKAGGIDLKPEGGCQEFINIFALGDFPISITDSTGENIQEQQQYDSNNYIVTLEQEKYKVSTSKKSCGNKDKSKTENK